MFSSLWMAVTKILLSHLEALSGGVCRAKGWCQTKTDAVTLKCLAIYFSNKLSLRHQR